jgi:hypothetical protein
LARSLAAVSAIGVVFEYGLEKRDKQEMDMRRQVLACIRPTKTKGPADVPSL